MPMHITILSVNRANAARRDADGVVVSGRRSVERLHIAIIVGNPMRSTIVRGALMGCALWLLSLSGVFAQAPTPLVSTGQPVTWWVVFKFNTASFAGCGGPSVLQCTFGGTPKSTSFG